MDTHATPTTQPVIIIACTGAKADHATAVRDLYQGQTFSLALRGALAEVDGDASRVLVISALHGLVGLDDIVAPYDQRIGDAGAVTPEVIRDQAEARGLADGTEVYAMVPANYFHLLVEALLPIGTAPQMVFEATRGIGDQRGIMSKCVNWDAE